MISGGLSEILVPAVVAGDDPASLETAISRTPFFGAWQVLTALDIEDRTLHRTLARLAAAGPVTGRDPDPDVNDIAMVEIDADTLPRAFADQFRLRLLSRTSNPHTVTAILLRDHVLAGGSANPNPHRIVKGFPLGERIRAARAAYRRARR